MTLPQLESLQAIGLPEPGSLIIATVPPLTTMQEADALLQELHRTVPDVRVLVVSSGVRVAEATEAEKAWLVVATLANGPQPIALRGNTGYLHCLLCEREGRTPSSDPDHAEDCPWRQAVALLEEDKTDG